MTYEELFDSALGILEYSDRQNREAFALEMIDLVLAELWNINNRIREQNGKEPMKEIPICDGFDGCIPYEEEIVRRDMLLGLVCRLVADEEDPSLHSFYSAEYELAKRDHRDRTVFKIEDYYS